jgi:hypothetical protein
MVQSPKCEPSRNGDKITPQTLSASMRLETCA